MTYHKLDGMHTLAGALHASKGAVKDAVQSVAACRL